MLLWGNATVKSQKDSEALKQVFEQSYGYEVIWCILPVNVRALHPFDAVIRAMNRLLAAETPEDMFIIYYNGRGMDWRSFYPVNEDWASSVFT